MQFFISILSIILLALTMLSGKLFVWLNARSQEKLQNMRISFLCVFLALSQLKTHFYLT